MTVQEFVNAVTQNPHNLNLKLCVVTNSGTVDKGQYEA